MLTAETDHMSEREFSAMAEYVELARSTGGSMTIGHHGEPSLTWQNQWGGGSSVTGISSRFADAYKAAGIAAGLLVIDYRPCEFWAVYRHVVSGPMMAEGWEQHSIAPAPLPIVAFSRIPRDEYARRARAIGADVHNA